MAERLESIAAACDERRPEEAKGLLDEAAAPAMKVSEVDRVARRLRTMQHPAAFAATTAPADIRHALRLLAELRELNSPSTLAVIGDAGTGKSHLAAEITASRDGFPAGIFIRGSELARGSTLDELARRVPGLEVGSFERLLEACDAAGARAGARIPIVIDGLNEAQRPADWQALLAQVQPALSNYPNVRLILTYRGAVRDDVGGRGMLELELELQDAEVREAVGRYFDHYKIDPGSARLPMGLFRELLYLRMFCEATNSEAEEWVGVEALPGSLVAVFERYVEQTAKRLRDRPGHPALPERYIETKLAAFALLLWERRARDIPWDEAKLLFDGDEAEWDHSLLKALEQEGILFRDDRLGHGSERSAVLFDRLSGYLIADAITRGLSLEDAEDVLGAPELWGTLTRNDSAGNLRGRRGEVPAQEDSLVSRVRGLARAAKQRVGRLRIQTRQHPRSSELAGDDAHPLRSDILASLVGLVPRRFAGKQLWKVAPDDQRTKALLAALDLESRYLDDETVDALCELIATYGPPGHGRRHPFDRLWEVRDGTNHRLNARFLDRVLRSMPIAQRDLGWTEWVRDREWLIDEVEAARAHWEANDSRDEIDELGALAIAWLLSSTVMPLRDAATRALHRYGTVDPRRMFVLAGSLLDVDDPYVSERAVAAAFGAATSHQMPDPGGPFERALGEWLAVLASAYVGEDATQPTSHQLIRTYARGSFELAAALHPAALPNGIDSASLTFARGTEPEAIADDDVRLDEVDKTFGTDFANYVIGPLFEDRGNYQDDHVGFQRGLADVRGRVWELGWRAAVFEAVDNRLWEDRWRRHESADSTERYGKKYGWIGFYELAGRLDDAGEHRERWSGRRDGVWPDIDPTFPAQPLRTELVLPDWASVGPSDPREWMRDGETLVPDDLLRGEAVNGTEGPWLLVEGHLRHADTSLNRRVWGHMRGVLVMEAEHEELVRILEGSAGGGNQRVPDLPSAISTFAGEIPWSRHFAASASEDEDRSVYRERVKANWQDEGVEIELLGHEYGFEGSRTVTAEASGVDVPSYSFAQRFDLRQRPASLDLVTLDGGRASLSLRAPEGWEGHLLYLRRDLLAEFADGRRLVQLAWGERQLSLDARPAPGWLQQVLQNHENVWRRIVPDALS